MGKIKLVLDQEEAKSLFMFLHKKAIFCDNGYDYSLMIKISEALEKLVLQDIFKEKCKSEDIPITRDQIIKFMESLD